MILSSSEVQEWRSGGIELDNFGLGGNVLFTGSMTGVQIVSIGYIKRASTVVKTLTDEEEEEVRNAKWDFDHDGEQEVFRVNGRSKLCRPCGQLFFSISAVKENYIMCKVPSQSRILVDRPVRHAHYLI